MNVTIHDHQGKALPIAEALLAGGHQLVNQGAELVLLDHDTPPFYLRKIEAHPQAKIVLYPHGGMAHISWDGIWPVHERTNAMLVIGVGQAETLERFGYPRPVHVIGWPWGGVKPFIPAKKVETVLFAPIHELNNGFIPDFAREANRRTFMRLLELPVRVMVRYIGKLENLGLFWNPAVFYCHGSGEIGTAGREQADVVVSRDTFAYAAVARGQPTVMFGQDIHQWDGHSQETIKLAAHWDDYKDLLRFPLDADEPDLMAVLQNAAKTDGPIREWRERFIGKAMDEKNVVRILEDIVAVR